MVVAEGLPMNHSIYSADRGTHLKVVVFTLAVGTALLGTALTIRLTHPELSKEQPRVQTVYQPQSTHALVEMVHHQGRGL
jgi:hypothetical protein